MTRARLLLGTNKLPEPEPEDGNHREPCNEIFIETARGDRHRLQHFADGHWTRRQTQTRTR